MFSRLIAIDATLSDGSAVPATVVNWGLARLVKPLFGNELIRSGS